jgi:hypothetical protein
MLIKTRARLTMKIGSKLSLCPHRYFTEHLVDAFKKSPRESKLNYKILSFSIRQLKNNIGFILQQTTPTQAKIAGSEGLAQLRLQQPSTNPRG